MIKIKRITIEEFENNIYDKYVNLFPEEEQRDWDKVKKTYEAGLERFYAICLENDTTIGFFMLEKLNNHPFYLEYFAIFDEYQNMGFGEASLRLLLKLVVMDKGIIGEIEKINDNKPDTIRRLKLYEKIGLKKSESEYIVTGVWYNAISNFKCSKEKLDNYFFDYYKLNFGADYKDKCKIIK